MKTYICPKCGGTWRPVRELKSGVPTELDRCGRCAGTFLDEGELERLIKLEVALQLKIAKGKP